jgi:hypothetical protein
MCSFCFSRSGTRRLYLSIFAFSFLTMSSCLSKTWFQWLLSSLSRGKWPSSDLYLARLWRRCFVSSEISFCRVIHSGVKPLSMSTW